MARTTESVVCIDTSTGGTESLCALDIAVVARRTGGKSGMLVLLFTATGEVLVRRVSSAVAWPADTLPATGQGRLLA